MNTVPWRNFLCVMTSAAMTAAVSAGEDIHKISLPTNAFIERADFYYWRPQGELKAVLLLCPGKNGNGESWVREAKWQTFAREQGLLLCGLSFASKQNYPLPDYSNAHMESGDMVLSAIQKANGDHLPLLLYGFSAGARFTASFIERYPEKVLTWCGCAVGQWVPPLENVKPPAGIVATGEYDAGCFWASLQYFQRGRQLGREWTWVSAPKVSHQRSPELEDFIRFYFRIRLERMIKGEPPQTAEWRDIDTKKIISTEELHRHAIFATSLPDSKLAVLWMRLHHP